MVLIFLIALALMIWLFLLIFWGGFWYCDQYLDQQEKKLEQYPTVGIVVPARNEADVIKQSLQSLLTQKYAGKFFMILIDDHSCDRTSAIAQETANQLDQSEKLTIITGKPLPSGWKGKLWAMNQGIESTSQHFLQPDYFLLTDADIAHHSDNLEQLVTKAKTENLDLVSLMVLLRCSSFWERLLIPAFVFFFQKLYPFAWVNNPQKSIAAAAGGCILINRNSLQKVGGIETIKAALIDDCSLAKVIKAQHGKIWLGLTQQTISLRPYESLKTIWDTIARTAFTQLNYSFWLLIGTLMGMMIVYLIFILGLIRGIQTQDLLLIVISISIWLLMTLAYIPTIKLYKLNLFWALSLPVAAFLYTLMTIDSAIKYYQGKGGAWKGRTYS